MTRDWLIEMTVEELIEKMGKANQINPGEDEAQVHSRIDTLLLEYINDPRVSELYKEVGKWFE